MNVLTIGSMFRIGVRCVFCGRMVLRVLLYSDAACWYVPRFVSVLSLFFETTGCEVTDLALMYADLAM